ncbi:MAG: hypothetical protein LAT64_06505 [Phycisphaerales bacterium]|nr:hypothetical protein [Planctomycetota bacterium]MCH8508406.1 hypothetical protein [Phycisphaerales bacterium]
MRFCVGAVLIGAAAGLAQPARAGGDATPGFVAYVSALGSDAVIRFRSVNADGRLDGPGDAVVFFGPGNQSGFPGVGSAQCLLVLGPDDVLAGDGEGSGGFTKRVYRMRDQNGDGTAMGPGEGSVFWDARLPLPGSPLADRPKEIFFVPGGQPAGPGGVPPLYLADNNTINFAGNTPEAIWRLDDLDADGVIDTDLGEVTLFHELSPAGSGFGFISEDFRFHPDGRLFFSNQVSSSNTGQVWIIHPDGTRTMYLDRDSLVGQAVKPTGMTLHPVTNNPVMVAVDIQNNLRIVELADLNGNGFIDGNSEVIPLYRSNLAQSPVPFNFNTVLDIEFAPDGSLWILDISDNSIIRFEDLNGDGTFNGPGEARRIYRAADAAARGGLVIDFPRTVAFGPPPCPADLAPPFGVLNFFDIAAFIELYLAEDPRADLAEPFGVFNFFDVAAYMDLYAQGCP